MAENDQIELELESSEETEVSVEPNVDADQFEQAESATQSRINRLTKKMREAERRENEALNYAKQVQAEANSLKQRMSSLDNSYVNEYTTRVETQLAQTEKEMARAMELGDTQAAVEAQRKLTSLSIENDRASQAKMQQERQKEAASQQPQQQAQPQQQQMRRPDRKAEDWAEKNEWFGQDEAMTFAAFGIHKKLVEEEGFDPQSDDYYNELDQRISEKFRTPANNTSRRPAQTVAGVSRSTSGRSTGKKVRLTPSQVAIAKKLGVPLSEYAKYVKD
jgi:chromosome segregation ATPase